MQGRGQCQGRNARFRRLEISERSRRCTRPVACHAGLSDSSRVGLAGSAGTPSSEGYTSVQRDPASTTSGLTPSLTNVARGSWLCVTAQRAQPQPAGPTAARSAPVRAPVRVPADRLLAMNGSQRRPRTDYRKGALCQDARAPDRAFLYSSPAPRTPASPLSRMHGSSSVRLA
jgi:hypothetical protein